MKKLLFLACIFAGMLVSCSSDLIDSETDQGSLYNEENVPNDGISFSFRLLNEDGEKTTTFKYGDNIMFDFVINNNCDTFMVYTSEKEEWIERIVSNVSKNGPDMFLPRSRTFLSVYNEEEKEMGVPYAGMWCNFSMQNWMTLSSHSTYHLRCPWKETGTYNDATYPLCGPKEHQEDLPKGKYHVSFSIKYREKANDLGSKFKTIIFKYPFEVV